MIKTIICEKCNKEVEKTGARQKYCKHCAKEIIIQRNTTRRLNNLEKAREYVKAWHDRNKEYVKNYAKKYYQQNKERIKQNTKNYVADNKENVKQKKRQYYKDNKEIVAEKNLHYRLNNPDKIKAIRRNNYSKNKEEILKRNHAWLIKNMESNKEYKKNYHDMKKFDGNRIPALERDNYTCQICGSKKLLVVHHKNGTNNLKDLVTLCRTCHITIHHLMRIYKKKLNRDVLYDEIVSKIF